MSQCGLGDAGFLPQALQHGGLELRRISPVGSPAEETYSGKIIVGEILWPRDREGSTQVIVPAPGTPLVPEAALPQSFSVLVHVLLPSSRAVATRVSTRLQVLLEETNGKLAYKWWQGMTTAPHTEQRRSTINLHLSTSQDHPLTPYDFETAVMPLLKQVARRVKQDGLLVRFDNPSTNFLVFCASQDTLVARGQPCPAGHQHPA